MKVVNIKVKPEYFEYVAKQIDNIEGTFVEMGFGEGYSANQFARLMNEGKIAKRNLWLYDSFTGFPHPTKEDISPRKPFKGEWARPIEPALAIKNKIDTNVEVVKGYFEEVLPQTYTGGPIAILHLDCDLYSSYKVCLENLYEKVAPGGAILFDEYKSPVALKNFPGASKAIDDFFVDKDIEFVMVQFPIAEQQRHYIIKPF